MRLLLVAVGRMKSGPETELADRYQDRAAKAGKSLGFRSVDVVVLDESRSADSAQRKADEAAGILKVAAGRIVALDERGKAIASDAFAARLGQWKDSGEDATTLVIGGPDGLDATIRDKADLVISFGAMTWPHQLVRVMALEQIYRAVTILSGHPYHRV
ncbi:23S rRNA (pseudouridine(1915)-N(3))-methyltransferase RlmH [Phreatobacter aquaticus]|uniref:Ribosomal RNA large subunit methyltransferase H n=1 Tax=Phreatobacter aquaticus TaxID=2570229 RepID=A0A4D7QCC4_9HYPH|nr:23S rRNA (pseudouridine(1915)-N(3))-methyltransferase RlmH [Phreatobacter aquaticus]QCK85650.1 23S rRNA (pseudouridine(1915)-N(3))-methyltransferase RlmH [Phreatobacter aquaticus]